MLFKIYDIKNKFIKLIINSNNQHTTNVTVNRDLRAESVLIAPFINQLRDILKLFGCCPITLFPLNQAWSVNSVYISSLRIVIANFNIFESFVTSTRQKYTSDEHLNVNLSRDVYQGSRTYSSMFNVRHQTSKPFTSSLCARVLFGKAPVNEEVCLKN